MLRSPTSYKDCVAVRRFAPSLGLYHLAGHVDLVARRWAGSTSGGGAYSMRLVNSCTSVFNTGINSKKPCSKWLSIPAKVQSKCLPESVKGFDCNRWTEFIWSLLDFVLTQCVINCFKSVNIDVINYWLSYFKCKLSSGLAIDIGLYHEKQYGLLREYTGKSNTNTSMLQDSINTYKLY